MMIVLVQLIDAIRLVESKAKSISICSFSSFIFELRTLKAKRIHKTKRKKMRLGDWSKLWTT